MDKALVEKFVDMIMKDICGVTVYKKVGDISISIQFSYDAEKDVITYDRGVYAKWTRPIDKGTIKDISKLSSFIEQCGLSLEIEEKVKQRIAKDEQYLKLKNDMLSKLEAMNLEPRQKQLVLSVIETVTKPSDRVGAANRVYIVTDGDYSAHVRVAGPNGWSDDGEELHLQMVECVDLGVKHHNYPNLSFEELVGKILSSPILAQKSEKVVKP